MSKNPHKEIHILGKQKIGEASPCGCQISWYPTTWSQVLQLVIEVCTNININALSTPQVLHFWAFLHMHINSAKTFLDMVKIEKGDYGRKRAAKCTAIYRCAPFSVHLAEGLK